MLSSLVLIGTGNPGEENGQMIERHEKVPERAGAVSQTKHTVLLPHVNLQVSLTALEPSLTGLGKFGEQASRFYRRPSAL